jgi:hypothetical protein
LLLRVFSFVPAVPYRFDCIKTHITCQDMKL